MSIATTLKNPTTNGHHVSVPRRVGAGASINIREGVINGGNHDFDHKIDRRGTGSIKWHRYQEPNVSELWIADTDFHSPKEVIDALHKRVSHGVFGYAQPTESTKQSIIDYLENRHNYQIKSDWLVWSHGMVPALAVACLAYAKEGESVLTCTPAYPAFVQVPSSRGRKIIPVPLCLIQDRWTFDWKALEAAVKKDTRVFFLCNPHNPVGRVWTREELEKITKFCVKHDLVIVSDEIHCDLVLDEPSGVRHIMTATLSKEIEKRTITLMSPSKTYNLSGLGCAFGVISNPDLRKDFRKAAYGLITEINAFGYVGLEAAYRHGEPWRQKLITYLRGNRKFLYNFIAEHLPEIKLNPMEATFLAWMDVRNLGIDDPYQFFLKAGVRLYPGEKFGEGGDGYLRLNFGYSRLELEKDLIRMRDAVRKLKK